MYTRVSTSLPPSLLHVLPPYRSIAVLSSARRADLTAEEEEQRKKDDDESAGEGPAGGPPPPAADGGVTPPPTPTHATTIVSKKLALCWLHEIVCLFVYSIIILYINFYCDLHCGINLPMM